MPHEDLARDQYVEGSSDRTFGLVVAGVCLLVGLGSLRHGHEVRWWAFTLAGLFAVVALLRPTLLTRLNHWWTRLGVLLGKVVSPIALGILFYGALMPMAIVMRVTRRDPLRLKFDHDTDSYWIARKPPGPPPGSMSNQF